MTDQHSLRTRLIRAWAELVTSRPRTVLASATAIALACIVLTLTTLEYRADRSALVDPTLGWQVRYAEYKEAFPRWDDLIVALDLSGSDRSTAESFMRDLRARAERDNAFSRVTIGFDASTVGADAIYSRPFAEVQDAFRRLASAVPVLNAPDAPSFVALSQLLGTRLNDAQQSQLAALLRRGAEIAGGADRPLLDAGADSLELLTTSTGNTAFALISKADDAELDDAIASLRAHIGALLDEPGYSSLDAGVTGVPVLESDETVQSTRDATFASVLSLSLIALLMVVVYRRVEVPLMAIFALLVGVAASFGWVAIAVGHLQVLSVVFAVVLLGLGIDTAIHFIARLELLHADHDHMKDALVRTFQGVGPGVLTGALTTAAAFGATAFTEFTGVAEMGVIASGGVLICTLVIVAVFPALLVLIPNPQKRLRDREGGEGKPFMGALGVSMDRHAKLVLIVSLVAVSTSVWLARGVRYDPDLIALMPENAESVQWERRISADDAQSVWNAVIVADGEADARRIIEAFRSVPEVAGVGGAADLIDGGPDLAQKLALARTLPNTENAPPSVRDGLADALRREADALAERWSGVNDAIAGPAREIAESDDASLARIANAYADERDALTARLSCLQNSRGPTLASLPPELHELVVSELGEGAGVLLRVTPHDPPAGTTVLSPENLNPFAEAVLAVSPGATGPTIQIYESSKLIARSYAQSALYALLAIAVLLLVDFRNLGDAICALIPVLCGASIMLAVMALIGEPLNFANTIVMPLIAGLGVDAGVHAVHRWRQQPMGQPAGLAGGTGRAIGITTLTTVIGFACMLTAHHRGIRSLGLVMSIGLGATWLATVTLLPALLRVRTQRGERAK